MAKTSRKRDELDREIIKALLDSGAVDFEAIGAALAKYGPEAALMWPGDDEHENFCLTMKLFTHVFRHPRYPSLAAIRPEDLSKLREVISPKLRGE